MQCLKQDTNTRWLGCMHCIAHVQSRMLILFKDACSPTQLLAFKSLKSPWHGQGMPHLQVFGMHACITLPRTGCLPAMLFTCTQAINAPRQVTCAGVCCEAGVVAVAGTLCSNSTGPCDEPAYCDGQYEDCPANPLASSTTVSHS